ncbi:MAG TPA: hypothetical protein DEQ30_09620 [Porphyromonadaceae bacterium]|nr:hypothetical protein [Porphyromonadaceae bacterium]
MSGISHSAFITLLRSGTRYTGYVEGLGDVEWIEEPVNFVKIYQARMGLNGPLFAGEYASRKAAGNTPERRWAVIDYIWRELNDVSIWIYRSRNFEIRTKRRYRIKVTPNPVKNREYYYAVRDNLRVENIKLSLAYIEKELNLLGHRERELANALGVVNSAMGNSGVSALLDVLGEFDITPKSVGRFTDILSCVSIIVDLDDENYEDAIGNSFVFLAGKGLGRIGLGWLSTAFSVGSFLMDTDWGKEERLKIELKNYMDTQKKWIDAYNSKETRDVNNRGKLQYKMEAHQKNYNKLCDELNVPHLKLPE